MTAPIHQSRHVRLFRNNRNQAVRIPVEFELPGDEAIITRDGDRLIIEPLRKKMTLTDLLAAWQKQPPLGPDDDFPDIDDPPLEPEELL
ncbi:AbrB/MazE/SpoVT family DNA-binding domain-containing protein [Roseomonas hellenica]|uniref:AbrB/MazE/SpoVT family DNA-binding domain-containing protein n=1 Tax=Plastoroseomonas hellenica TaxID=2687306 RepID=A0ABS5EWP1_9PROT|nr:AbrB/MazE/SpoVT family DNA-binding domain-containing protein [Plastoroseomonas hellenica]MBR0664705.1 AbrB/MazE/SpoVT family DNA-binding domain-containing protein [Plastoroseomonas hellenica]